MSYNINDDILRPLCDDEAEQMMNICAKSLPLNIRGYSFLRHLLLWNKRIRENVELNEKIKSDYMLCKIYTKRGGKLENCTFVSISGTSDYTLFISSIDLDELKECLMKTNLIDWTLGPSITSFEGRHRPNLTEVFIAREIKIEKEIQNTANYVKCTDALAYNIEIPDDVIIEPLTENDVRVIDNLWFHKYDGSYEYIKSLVVVNDSLGIFSKDRREIYSWVIITEQFTPGMLQTTPKQRGKGYAKLLMRLIAKLIAEKYGIDCYVFIYKGNQPSETLFRYSLGYKPIPMPNDYSWIWTKKSHS